MLITWQFNIQSHVTSDKISRETILAFDLIAQSNNSNKRKIDLVHQILEDIFGEDFKNFKLEFEKYYFNDVLHIHGTAEGDPDYLINSSAAYARLYFKN